MAAENDLKLRCPACHAKYRFPAHAVGRKARCPNCQTLFRITAPHTDTQAAVHDKRQPSTAARLPGVPTDDDILRWLSEAEDEADRERRDELSGTDVGSFEAPSTRHMETEAPLPRLRLHRELPEETGDLMAMRRVV